MRKLYLMFFLILFSFEAGATSYSKILPDDYTVGDENAKLYMIMYSSFSCPYCSHFYNEVFPLLQQKYIDTKKLVFVNRSVMTDKVSMAGTMLALCNISQSSDYFMMTKLLYKHFPHWVIPTGYMEKLEKIAGLSGMSKEEFNKCQDNIVLRDKLMEKQKQGSIELKIDAIPFLIINGKEYKGPYNFENISQYLDTLLAEAEQSTTENNT